MMTFNPVAPGAPADVKNALNSLKMLVGSRSNSEMGAHLENLSSQLSQADEEATYLPSPELSCRPSAPREHRRPVIMETRAMSASVTLAAAEGLVAKILAGVFPTTDSKRFLYADGTYKASVEGRQLAALAFNWDLLIFNRFNRHTGGTASASVAAAIDEIRVWTEAELAPLKRVLNQCTVQIFGTSSNDPGMDEVQLSYFGEEGKQIPRNLHPHTFYKEKEAKVVITPPTSYPDIIIPAAIDGRTPQVTVFASLTVGGLFLDRDFVPKTLRPVKK